MSVDKNRHEAQRWLKTALDDFNSAQILRENLKFAHACFHAQQAGEKALKALWYYHEADPWGHSLKRLLDELEQVDACLYESCKIVQREALVLDRYYIPTRYPNGLPDVTPDMAFDGQDAGTCIEYAEKIIDVVKPLIGF